MFSLVFSLVLLSEVFFFITILKKRYYEVNGSYSHPSYFTFFICYLLSTSVTTHPLHQTMRQSSTITVVIINNNGTTMTNSLFHHRLWQQLRTFKNKQKTPRLTR
ncbi:MAG: hypothetical protein J3R72DRAFT_71077 [Linnemannia gamsii]|nr:MAG: hypothetical protein J3R72DRAFT_71077 [Linnemannia gamsii]